MKKSIDYYIKLSKSSLMNTKLNMIAQEIQEKGFDLLTTSDYIFLIRMYIGKIATLYEEHSNDKTLFLAKVEGILKKYNLDIEDYTNNDYTIILKNSRDVAKIFIEMYKKDKL